MKNSTLAICKIFNPDPCLIVCLSEDPPSTGSDLEKQLLEAARSGDMEVVKVRSIQDNKFIFESWSVTYSILCFMHYNNNDNDRLEVEFINVNNLTKT